MRRNDLSAALVTDGLLVPARSVRSASRKSPHHVASARHERDADDECL